MVSLYSEKEGACFNILVKENYECKIQVWKMGTIKSSVTNSSQQVTP